MLLLYLNNGKCKNKYKWYSSLKKYFPFLACLTSINIEMGDRFATTGMARKVVELLCPFLWGGAGSPFKTMSPERGLPSYQVAS